MGWIRTGGRSKEMGWIGLITALLNGQQWEMRSSPGREGRVEANDMGVGPFL